MIQVIENLTDFVYATVPEGGVVKCRVSRNRKGVDKGLFPTYFLHLERENGRPIFLLAARKRRKLGSSNYIISTDPTDLSREGESLVGKLQANLLGAKFMLMGGTTKSRTRSQSSDRSSSDCSSSELCCCGHMTTLAEIQYEIDILGVKGPRRIKVLLPGPPQGIHKTQIILKSKKAPWDHQLNSYVLNFYGRANQASVKNFQLIHESQPESVLLQFGKLTDDTFILDVRYPLNPVQAFGIALSSFDCKIACE